LYWFDYIPIYGNFYKNENKIGFFFREIINYFSLTNAGSMVLHEGVPHLVSTAARLFGRQPDVILGNPRTLLFLLQKILHNKKPGIQPGLEKKWWFFKL